MKARCTIFLAKDFFPDRITLQMNRDTNGLLKRESGVDKPSFLTSSSGDLAFRRRCRRKILSTSRSMSIGRRLLPFLGCLFPLKDRVMFPVGRRLLLLLLLSLRLLLLILVICFIFFSLFSPRTWT